MNLLDIALAVLCIAFGVFGIVRGLVRQLFSLGGLIAGHLAGIRFYGTAASTLRLSFQYSDVVGYLLVFVLVYLAVRLLGAAIEGKIRASKLSGADRLAGMAVGLGKGVLVSVLIVFLLVILLPKEPQVLRESKAAPYAILAGKWLAEAFPDRIAGSFRDKVRSVEGPPRSGPPPRK